MNVAFFLRKLQGQVWFKKVYFGLSVLLLILGLLVVVRPDPFLRFGYWGVFVFNTLGGIGTYLIPPLALKMNLFWLSLATALGMMVNDSLAWVAGRGGAEVVGKFRWVTRVEKMLDKYGWWSLFVISVLPFPYDAIGLALGYLGLDYWRFALPLVVGKFVRMMLIGLGTIQVVKYF